MEVSLDAMSPAQYWLQTSLANYITSSGTYPQPLGCCGCLVCDFNMLAEEVEGQLDVLNTKISYWAKGLG